MKQALLLTLLVFTLQVTGAQLEECTWPSHYLKNKRQVWIYTPQNYSKSANPYPLLLVFDGQAYVSELIPLPEMLDKLTNEKAIPAVVAVFISSIDQPARNRELPCYPPFVNFLTQELLPWVRTQYNVSLDPSKSLLIGSSYGGLAACFTASKHPELFGNVLSQSGAFWWDNNAFIHLWKTLQKMPLRFYLDVGTEETHEMIALNRTFRDLLQSQHYSVYYREFNGDHDYQAWRDAISDGLIYLLK